MSMFDTASHGIGTGLGIAAMGIGLGIAFDSMRGIQKQVHKKKNMGFKPMSMPSFKPIRIKW